MLYNYLYYIILPILAISAILTVYRFVKGPTIADRVVALDLLFLIGIGIISVYSIVSNESTFLDIAMIFALIGFLSTTGFSYYLDKWNKDV